MKARALGKNNPGYKVNKHAFPIFQPSILAQSINNESEQIGLAENQSVNTVNLFEDLDNLEHKDVKIKVHKEVDTTIPDPSTVNYFDELKNIDEDDGFVPLPKLVFQPSLLSRSVSFTSPSEIDPDL